MSLENFFHSMEMGLVNFGRRLCRDPRADLRDAVEEVQKQLHREREILRRCQEKMAELRQRVRASEERAALLGSRIESFLYVQDSASAYDHALELDNTRRRLADDREGLRRALRVERECLDLIRGLERRYDELQMQLRG